MRYRCDMVRYGAVVRYGTVPIVRYGTVPLIRYGTVSTVRYGQYGTVVCWEQSNFRLKKFSDPENSTVSTAPYFDVEKSKNKIKISKLISGVPYSVLTA